MEAEQPADLHSTARSALSRRAFLTTLSAAALVASCRTRHRVTLGVQSYSFRDRTLDDAIAALQLLGLRSCELWSVHVEPRGLSRDDLRRWRETTPMDHFHVVREKLRRASIQLSAYNISFRDDFSDAEIERGFEMAASLGAPAITSSSNVKTVARVAPIAERRTMLVAMHNHSRIDPNEFATAESLTTAMSASPFIAVNLDIGHFTAANFNALEYLDAHHAEIVSLHIKDRKRDQGPNVPFGEGDTPITAVLQRLRDRKWDIPAQIEYEYKGADTNAEVRRCLEYCRKSLG